MSKSVTTRKKAVVEEKPVVVPAKRGRKPGVKVVAVEIAPEPVKRGRKPKAVAEIVAAPAPAKRGRKPAAPAPAPVVVKKPAKVAAVAKPVKASKAKAVPAPKVVAKAAPVARVAKSKAAPAPVKAPAVRGKAKVAAPVAPAPATRGRKKAVEVVAPAPKPKRVAATTRKTKAVVAEAPAKRGRKSVEKPVAARRAAPVATAKRSGPSHSQPRRSAVERLLETKEARRQARIARLAAQKTTSGK